MGADKIEFKVTPVFNKFSASDKAKLHAGATVKALTGFVREDTARRPYMYPFYMVYLLVLTTPLPVPMAGSLLAAATVAFASTRWTPWARKVNDRLRESFNEKAVADMVADHNDCIVPYPSRPERLYVKNLRLSWQVTKHGLNDSWEATKSAGRAALRLIGLGRKSEAPVPENP